MLTPAYLERMRERIQGDIARIEHLLSAEDPDTDHRQTLLDQWRRLEEALTRIHQGSFGKCLDCGEPISLYQLAGDPAASRCTYCLRDHISAQRR